MDTSFSRRWPRGGETQHLLRALKAAPDGNNRYVARCPCCQKDSRAKTGWRLLIAVDGANQLIFYCSTCSRETVAEKLAELLRRSVI